MTDNKPEVKDGVVLFRVASSTDTSSIASAIATVFIKDEAKKVELQAMGAGAISQAVKGIASARSMASAHGFELICWPGFRDVIIDGKEKTGVSLWVKNNN